MSKFLKILNPGAPVAPRQIDPARTFDSIAAWIAGKSVEERAPGLIVGLSGTDSIVSFLAGAEAFKRLGKPGRVLGVNFQHDTHNDVVNNQIACIKTEFNWVARDILPWLTRRVPDAKLEIDSSIPHSDDNIRWGHLFSRAISDSDPRAGLLSCHYFPVGTRNATEQALGHYTQISRNVSILPLIQLYKSEVLEMCQYLGVPQIAIDKSREIDCDCGRFETQAHYMREVDLYLMYKQGLLAPSYLEDNVPPDILHQVVEFYVEEDHRNAFRKKTPHLPEENLVVTYG